MSVEIINSKKQQIQKRIFNVLTALGLFPKVSIVKINDLDIIEIRHNQQFVPDFRFEWCNIKNHYRVYIKVASTDYEKTNAGYCICTMKNYLVASGFITLYCFLHNNRANNKEMS